MPCLPLILLLLCSVGSLHILRTGWHKPVKEANTVGIRGQTAPAKNRIARLTKLSRKIHFSLHAAPAESSDTD